jgi:hypothetical protein
MESDDTPLRHLPVAIFVTSGTLFLAGYFLPQVLIYSFLATTTFVATDVILTGFIRTGPGRINVFASHLYATRGVGFWVLIGFMLIVAPIIAVAFSFAPGLVDSETAPLGVYSRLVTVAIISVLSMGTVGAYVRWLTRSKRKR